MAALKTEPGTTLDTEDRAILGDVAVCIYAEHSLAGLSRSIPNCERGHEDGNQHQQCYGSIFILGNVLSHYSLQLIFQSVIQIVNGIFD